MHTLQQEKKHTLPDFQHGPSDRLISVIHYHQCSVGPIVHHVCPQSIWFHRMQQGAVHTAQSISKFAQGNVRCQTTSHQQRPQYDPHEDVMDMKAFHDATCLHSHNVFLCRPIVPEVWVIGRSFNRGLCSFSRNLQGSRMQWLSSVCLLPGLCFHSRCGAGATRAIWYEVSWVYCTLHYLFLHAQSACESLPAAEIV